MFPLAGIGEQRFGELLFPFRVALRHEHDEGILRAERLGYGAILDVDARIRVLGRVDDVAVLQIGLNDASRGDERNEHERDDNLGRVLKIRERMHFFRAPGGVLRVVPGKADGARRAAALRTLL